MIRPQIHQPPTAAIPSLPPISTGPPASPEAWSELTFPRFRKFLRQPHPRIHVLRQSVDNQPAGLLLLHLPDASSPPAAAILSLFVVPGFRRRHIATNLLRHAAAVAGTHQRHQLAIRYSSRLANRPALEAVLNRAGFTEARPSVFRFKAPVTVIDDLRWDRYLERARKGRYRSTTWDALSVDQQEAFHQLCRQHKVPDHLQPFPYLAGAFPPLTIACFKGPQPAGWITAHTEPPHSLYFSSGYVFPELQRSGWLVAAIADVRQRFIRLHGIGESWNFHYTTDAENLPMRRLIDRYLAPRALWTDQILLRTAQPPPASS